MELLPEQKVEHKVVRYEHPSQHGGESCGNCIHLIAWGFPLRCETVKGPIQKEDWCLRHQDRG